MKYLLLPLTALLLSGCSEQANTDVQKHDSGNKIDKLVRSYYEPHNPRIENVTGVIILGGSEGGIDVARSMASRLSAENIGAMAVAYFGTKHLPEKLETIPLEYVEQAIVDLKKQPNIDTSCIGVLGYSRGGELALLMASKYPELKFAIGFAPAHAVFSNYPTFPGYSKSAWTFKGKELPFLTGANHLNYLRNNQDAEKFENALKKVKGYDKMLISVENINGPVLLFSGKDDQLWASSWMCEQVMKRLKLGYHPYNDRHVCYEKAGHVFSPNPYFTKLGGTVEANSHAELQSWKEIMVFLKEFRKSHTTPTKSNPN